MLPIKITTLNDNIEVDAYKRILHVFCFKDSFPQVTLLKSAIPNTVNLTTNLR
jgi:hypothetical protein